MLATTLDSQTATSDATSGGPTSPPVNQALPVPVPGSSASAQGQCLSEPIPQIKPHPERIARK